MMPPVQVKAAYVDVEALRIYYEELGEGPTVVLVHGGLVTGQMMWGARIASLAKHYRVLAPDSRGHGRTNNPAGKLDYGLMADDVAGFIAALGLERPTVVGYSDGAQIALELAMHHADLVKALVIGGAISQPTEIYLKSLRAMGFSEPGKVDLEQVERVFGAFFATLQTEHHYVYGPDYWRTLLSQISELWLTVPSYTDDQLASIPIPSLLISGDRDEGGLLDESLRLYRTMPLAELAVVPNANHGAVEQDLFWAPVTDFLSRNA